MKLLYQAFPSLRRSVAVIVAATIAAVSLTLPASAETAGQRSTRNIILGGLAAAAAVILYNNYHHKQVAANTVVGYTRDGGVVYGDGRVVYPDGTVLYTRNPNGGRCSYNGYAVPCNRNAYAYSGGMRQRNSRGGFDNDERFREDDQRFHQDRRDRAHRHGRHDRDRSDDRGGDRGDRGD